MTSYVSSDDGIDRTQWALRPSQQFTYWGGCTDMGAAFAHYASSIAGIDSHHQRNEVLIKNPRRNIRSIPNQ